MPAPGGVATPTRPEIIFGSVGTATGVIGAATQPIVAATKAWAADANTRGGLKGHPVRVIFGDDGGDPSRAQSLVRKMVEEEKVIAFVGTYLVITTAAVTDYVEKMQVPVIGGPGGNEVEDSSPMFFNPQIGADEALGHGLVHNIVAQTKARKIATFYCREASSCAAQAKRVKEYAHLYGAEVVLEAQVSLAQPDFTGEILAARSAGADAIVSAVDEASTVRVARSAKQQNYDPVIAGSYTVNNDVLLRAGEDAVGIIGFSATAPYGSSPLLQPYRDAVARHVPGARLAGYGATAWVQGKLVERLADFFGDLPQPDQRRRAPGAVLAEGRDPRRAGASDHLQRGSPRPGQPVHGPHPDRRRPHRGTPRRRPLRLRQGLRSGPAPRPGGPHADACHQPERLARRLPHQPRHRSDRRAAGRLLLRPDIQRRRRYPHAPG